MSSLPFCDILSVPAICLDPIKFYRMSRQSSRLRTNALKKKVQEDAILTSNGNEAKDKLQNGYPEKPTVDILSELKPDNSMRKKRKAVAEEKIAPDKNEPYATKQMKVEADYHEENTENLSEYEKMCRKNIEEKMAFFAALKFDEAKQDFKAAASVLKPKPKPKPTKLRIKKEEPLARRQSLRLQKNRQVLQPSPILEIAKQPVEEHKPRKPHGGLTFEEVFRSENQSYEELLKDLSMLYREEIKSEPFAYNRYESCFNIMRTNTSLITKIAPSRIFSVAVHPSTSKTLICAGSKYGHVSFWDVGSQNPLGGVYVYEPHSNPVNCVAFNRNHLDQIISCSYDGSVRCGHLEAGVFNEVYYTKEADDISCSHFDFLSSDSLLVSLSSGEVAVVDTRVSRHNKELHHTTHACPIKTVSVHPVKKDNFITAGRNGVVSLWDLRCLRQKSVANMELSRSVNSAYFSPVTGNNVLTTSLDNKLCLFDTTQLDKTIYLKKAIRHDNQTGRWLTGFRAVWLPNNEDAFVVGSMLQPRRIEVYRTSGTLAHNFGGEDLGSICSINAFHPSRPILAGANSSGKLHVFQCKE